MKKIKYMVIPALVSLLMPVLMIFTPIVGNNVSAVDSPKDSSAASKIAAGADNTGIKGGSTDLTGMIQAVINTMLFLIGIAAVIAIIISGFMYITSAGDPGKIKKAKDTLLYAVIGIVVAILSYAIVKWVIDSIK